MTQAFKRTTAFRSICLACLLSGAALSSTAQAQQQQDGDVPTIDLAPVLRMFQTEDASPEGGDEGTFSIPEYDRGGDDGKPQAVTSNKVLLPLRMAGMTATGHDRVVRLTGERAVASLFVDLPALAPVKSFKLSYRISINVLPARSQILISVNGKTLDPIQPTAFSGFEDIELPAEMLVPGRNEINVVVQESHRIFCGPEATFEIWTELDLGASGVEYESKDLAGDTDGFMSALLAQLVSQNVIPVRADDETLTAIMPALTERLAGLRNGAPVMLRPQGIYASPSIIPPVARITILPDNRDFAEIRQGADGAQVLVMSLTADNKLPNLDMLLPAPPPVPDVGILVPGQRTSLEDLKFSDVSAYNRYSEQNANFRLPGDWLVLSSQNAMLKLLYSFADGLPENALMLVKINGTTVRLLPLDQGGGSTIPLLDIGFPARLLHPGVNQLTFVSLVPGDPPDLPCPAFDSPLMTIDATSTLLVPEVPKMAFVNVSDTLAGITPDQIFYRSGSEEGESDIEMALKTAMRTLEGHTQQDGASLNVIESDSLDQISLGGLNLSRRELEAVFLNRRPAPMTQPIEDPSTRTWVMPAFSDILAAVGRNVRDLASPGDGDLRDWLSDRNGKAVVTIPQADDPLSLWLIVRPETDPAEIAAKLAQARLDPNGPSGRFALLTNDDQWESWHDSSSPPGLKEPLTLKNFREVAGNYASWSPLYFVLVLFGLTIISVCLALAFVVTTRGRRKR
ncbi:hypothetical protein DL237_14305 [Pseudooceanicola sediminis]|uniref:Cyclic di-GMP-binding protein n=1 Tax=Pseudooceanicola sediminis TaxID=2211117 RepID=A0A399IYK4_9RHOB|nr:cellulose biosynthesis cyclic di-GMP-binding regulatory protein BcsB [Pseudooceanicola sediminis]KAA2312092.1 cellulose biosynthesis cyclic di-GMP-binding regulatory protein BcsB [Puniceibacterium sp. HSS470]RII38101.1 hypothetical protein DL237_14305 [Pseudooceanicola sediminis]|tara:strand:+ start:24920 stop:27136 length:2217 start_codon:yes stop_codon:yes gene_type:complete